MGVEKKTALSKNDTLVQFHDPMPVVKAVYKPKEPKLTKLKQNLEFIEAKKQIREILNAIQAPRYWTENDRLWQQTISDLPATRDDAINLQEQLNKRLLHAMARETGICPIRRQLYSQCFDEIIRQSTINCAERGCVLLRIRDEIDGTMRDYERLYCNAVSFILRRSLLAHEEKNRVRMAIKQLEEERKELDSQIADIQAQIDAAEGNANDLLEAEEKKHAEEVLYLRKLNSQLKGQLESIVAPRK